MCLGPPVEYQIRVQEHAGGRQVVVAPAGLSGGYLRPAKAAPCPVRSRQHEAYLLDIRIAVDNDEQLRPVDRLGTSGNWSLRPGHPCSLALSAVDDHAQPHHLAVDIDQGRRLRRDIRFVGRCIARLGRGTGVSTHAETATSRPIP